MKLKFLRIQGLNFVGVYQTPATNCLFEVNFERHPLPFNDDLLVDNTVAAGYPKAREGFFGPWSKFHYGFSSLEQFRRWFYSEDILAKFAERGMALYVYEVEETELIKGYTQCVISSELFDKIKNFPVDMFELDKLPETI